MNSLFAIAFMFLMVISVGAFVLWIVALIDALKIPATEWEAHGENQILWIVLIVVLGAIGAILYWLMPRAKIKGSTSF